MKRTDEDDESPVPKIRSINDVHLEGRRVFIRVDFNVPLSEDGKVSDESRIRATLPTLAHALERGARVVLASHLGRPKGQFSKKFSLEPVGARLAELIPSGEVIFAEDCIGDGPRKIVNDLREGQITLLENLRFHPGEESNDEGFARELARMADVYIDDAFGAVHRAHASVSALPRLIPDRGAGLLLLSEIAALERVRDAPAAPYVAVLGGAKVGDKIAVIEALMSQVNALLVGGAMANTFLAAKGLALGKSRVESDRLAVARSLMQKASEARVEILLPQDAVVAPSLEAPQGEVVDVQRVPPDAMIFDIGPRTIAAFRERIASARTVFANGPMGVFERAPFAEGTYAVLRAMAECRGFTVIGGGDSLAAVERANLRGRFDHVSTGGGASLEFMEGRKLPGIEALKTV